MSEHIFTKMGNDEPKPIFENSQIDGEKFTDIYDVLSNIGKVHSRIQREITSDFIFAKLEQQDKEFVIEMTVNAFDVLKIYMQSKYNIIQNIGMKEYKIIEPQFNVYMKSSFDTFMNRVFMVVNMNRNTDGNFMINILSQIEKSKENQTTEVKNVEDINKRLKEMSNEGGK
jgi:hypothetical protein